VNGQAYHKKKYYFKKLLKGLGILYQGGSLNFPVWESHTTKISAEFIRDEDLDETIEGIFEVTSNHSDGQKVIDFLINEIGGEAPTDQLVKERLHDYKLWVSIYEPNWEKLSRSGMPGGLYANEKEKWKIKREHKMKELGVTEAMIQGDIPEELPPVVTPEEKKIEWEKKKGERESLSSTTYKMESKKVSSARNALLSFMKGDKDALDNVEPEEIVEKKERRKLSKDESKKKSALGRLAKLRKIRSELNG
jgi:hypothetical protein